MRYFLIIFTILYILLEIAFRARLLDTISVVANYENIENIEITGRIISSLGFAMLMISFLKYGKSKTKKILSHFAIFITSFMFFYLGQSFLVNQVVDSIDINTKKKTILLSDYKEDFYYELLENKPNGNTSQEKIYLATSPFLYLQDDELLNYFDSKANEIFSINLGFKLKHFSFLDELDHWNSDSHKLTKLWEEYRNYSNLIKNAKNKKPSEWEIEREFKKSKILGDWFYFDYRETILGLFIHNYRKGDHARHSYRNTGIVSSSGRGGTFSIAYFTKPVASLHGLDYLYNFSEEEFDSKKELEQQWDEGIKTLLIHNVKKQLEKANDVLRYHNQKQKRHGDFLSRYEKMVHLLDTKICYETDRLPEYQGTKEGRIINRMKKGDAIIRFRDMTFYEALRELDINFEIEKDYFICDTGKVAMDIHKLLMYAANHINSYYFGFERDYHHLNESFYNLPLAKKTAKFMYKKHNWDVPLGYKYYDLKTFLKYYKKFENEKHQNMLDSKIAGLANMSRDDYVKKYGQTKFGLTEPQFYNIAGVDLFIKKTFPFLFKQDGRWNIDYKDNSYNFIHTGTVDAILGKYVKDKYTYIAEHKYKVYSGKKDDQDLLDKFTKVTMVPVIILLISSLVIFLNIANLIILIFNITDFKKKVMTYGCFILLIMLLGGVDNRADLDKQEAKIVDALSTPSIILINFLKNSDYILEFSGILNKQMFVAIDEFEKIFLDKIKDEPERRRY